VPDFFQTKIEFLKGIGPQKAQLLNKELSIFTYADLVQHFPFRYEDRSKFYNISDLNDDSPAVQLKGRITYIQKLGPLRSQRLVASFEDRTGEIELVWFKGVSWIEKKIATGAEYSVFGKPAAFGSKLSISHPEIEKFDISSPKESSLVPVYSTTEPLKRNYLDSKAIGKIIQQLLEISYSNFSENLPGYLIEEFRLINKAQAMLQIHFPKDEESLRQARRRLKFEELFYIQLKLLSQKLLNKHKYKGYIFNSIPSVNAFYKDHLPFQLTGAQKRVIKEIYKDLVSGAQMNRLLQGDVGSGKTIVGFIVMLMALDNGAQACLMAPTEILAEQHYQNLKKFADKLNISIDILTGSTKKSARTKMLEALSTGQLKIIVGTHALLEDRVQFQNLGLCIIDEQHRFGVAQRARLWDKNKNIKPHVLVMTATPIPRTLAMTLYGDLDISVIDELPTGRKPIKTLHKYDAHRTYVFGFMKQQIEAGRQVYVVYPLIEESEKMDFKDLMDGYESISRAFPDVPLSIVHGKMKSKDKEFEMQRFKKGETKILVSTTVIEVGVDVPNASVMVIENAERFGLAALHQLRGRVGRGAEQSYCILMTGNKLSKDSKHRIETMVRTNNGFEIAEEDLKLRGPGDMAGTQQSGVLDLKISDLAKDQMILVKARECAIEILERDPDFILPEHQVIRRHIDKARKDATIWSMIS
jgi:ATP-dependent DNA helicase RecG